jgi:hypothetical protein
MLVALQETLTQIKQPSIFAKLLGNLLTFPTAA